MAKMITTNLRMEEDKYLALRVMAAEKGMSVNQYLTEMVEEKKKEETLGKKAKKKLKRKLSFYDAMLAMAQKKYESKPMGANEDDKIIYGIED